MEALRPGYPTAGALPAAQPTGWRYLVMTWSGRLLLLNAAMFAVICLKSGAIFLPDTETLLALGAKDPVRLAHGELWRLFLPMFIHIGIVHFAVNSYMLYVIGYQLERILGGPWFVAIYLCSGLAGNIASAVFSVSMSAGASSSLFGLLGAGLYLERTIGRRVRDATGVRPPNRAYLMTVIINLGFGMVVPFIDNSAHVGGLIAGTALTFAMVNLRPNALQRQRRGVGIAALALLGAAGAVGTYFGSSPRYVLRRVATAAAKASDPEQRIYLYSQALEIDPSAIDLYLKRAKELFAGGETQFAYHDLREAMLRGARPGELETFADELEAKGQVGEAWQVRRMVAHGLGPSPPANEQK